MTTRFDKQVSEGGVAYHRCGTGPSLLLIHGVGLRAESWLPLMTSLSDFFELTVIDLPGHGQSSGIAKDFDSVDVSDYLVAITEFAASIGLERYAVCGHSLGALLSIQIASSQPDKVTGLVALNTVFQRSEAASVAVKQRAESLANSGGSIVGVNETIERWFTSSPSLEMQPYARACEEWLRNNTVDGYSKAYKAFADQIGPSTRCLSRVNCETVFMTGDLDSNSSPEMTRQLCDNTKRASAVVVNGAGHMMPLTHWSSVSDCLLGLRNGLSANHSTTTVSFTENSQMMEKIDHG